MRKKILINCLFLSSFVLLQSDVMAMDYLRSSVTKISQVEVLDPPKESVTKKVEVLDPPKESVTKKVEVLDPPKESVTKKVEVLDPPKESVTKKADSLGNSNMNAPEILEIIKPPEESPVVKVVVKPKPKTCTTNKNKIFTISSKISDLLLKELARAKGKDRREVIIKEISPYFDKKYAAKMVLNNYDEQLKKINKLEDFENMLIERVIDQYADALGMVSKSTRIVLSKRKVDIVSKSLVDIGGKLKVKNRWLKLNYDLHCNPENGQWQVFDVTVDGVSIIRNYKSQIRALINKHGLVGMLGEFKKF